MYGLKEAAILTYNKLILHLKPRGYYPIPVTARLCRDKTSVQYFQDSLKYHFKFHIDLKGENYIGLKLD